MFASSFVPSQLIKRLTFSCLLLCERIFVVVVPYNFPLRNNIRIKWMSHLHLKTCLKPFPLSEKTGYNCCCNNLDICFRFFLQILWLLSTSSKGSFFTLIVFARKSHSGSSVPKSYDREIYEAYERDRTRLKDLETFSIGCKVEIFGLAKAPQYNGCKGKVQS